MFCTGCGTPRSTDDRFCASCGEPGGPAAPTTAAFVPQGGRTAPDTPEDRPRTSLDVHRLGVADLISGGGTLVVLLSLLMPWYTLHPNSAESISVSALVEPAGGFRVVLLVGAMATLCYLGFRTVLPPTSRWPVPHWQLLAAVAACDAFLALLGLLVRPSGLATGVDTLVDTGIGAYLGFLFSLVALAGAILRARQPEVVDARSWTDLASGPPLLAHQVMTASSHQAEPSVPVGAEVRPCPSCALPVDSRNRFCTECGALIVS